MGKHQPEIEKLISKLCPKGVEFRKLEDVVNVLDNQRKPISKSQRRTGKYPYYGANGIQDYVDDYIFDGTFLLLGEDGSVIKKDGSPVLNWATGKIWVNNHAHILSEKIDAAVLRYVFFVLQTIDVTKYVKGNIPKITQQNLRGLLIPVPPLGVQKEIVKILDTFTQLEAELAAELEARRKQYEHYRSQLLTFDDVGGVRWTTLNEIAKIKNGKDWKKLSPGNIPVYGTGGIMGYVDRLVYDKPTVLIPRKGSITNIFYIDEPFWNVDTIYYTEIDTKQVIPKFFYYFMKTIDLAKLDTGSGRPSLTQAILDKIKIPVPPLAEQERIVSILDKFDVLVNNISVGLPAELNARRSQYEYYRNKLLTFTEA